MKTKTPNVYTKHCGVCESDLYSIADKKAIEMYGGCLLHLTDEQFYCVSEELSLMETDAERLG